MKTRSRFDAPLRRTTDADGGWAFVLLPRDASARLPRRGRTTIVGTINGHAFSALLEPDGQKGHWLRVDRSLLDVCGAAVGDVVRFEIEAPACEPDPLLPPDLREALATSDAAMSTWGATTTIARVDWIHWIESAKQATTRAKRIRDALDMLSCGKQRVCCFDNSGFYSKAFRAPEADG